MDGIPGFILLAVLLSLTPGPDDVLVIRSSLRGGARLGAITVAGVATGALLWGLAAAAGLAAVLTAAPATYEVLHALGAGYLAVLGGLTVYPYLGRRARARVRAGHGAATPTAPAVHPAAGTGAWRAYTSGLLADVLNPKIGLFYLAVLPGFVPAGAPVLPYTLLLSAIDVAVATVWLVTVAVLATALVTRLRRPRVTACLVCGSGMGLLGIGTALAVAG
jgi:threonine/homoserine/homoserine lactone efflux protein